MTERISILIVEDDDILAMNLATAVEDRDCDVVGPLPSVAGALAALEHVPVHVAALDVRLLDGDVTPVAMELIDRCIPFVIHTGIGLPTELQTLLPHVPVIMKPAAPDAVITQLLAQLARLHAATGGASSPVDHIARDSLLSQQVARIGAALFEQFGDKAVVLARRQAADASGDVLASWSRIIRDLTARVDAESALR